MSARDPRYKTYKSKIYKFTPEEQAKLDRWREEIWKRAYERLREREGR
jgi:hypothetical protein